MFGLPKKYGPWLLTWSSMLVAILVMFVWDRFHPKNEDDRGRFPVPRSLIYEGTRLDRSMFEYRGFLNPARLINGVRSIDQLEGKVAVQDLQPGMAIMTHDLRDPDDPGKLFPVPTRLIKAGTKLERSMFISKRFYESSFSRGGKAKPIITSVEQVEGKVTVSDLYANHLVFSEHILRLVEYQP